MLSVKNLMENARRNHTAIPGFNIPYLPMMEPVVRALCDCNTIGLIMMARLEWEKFESGSLKAVYDEYQKVKDERFTRLHLDHVPAIDEDQLQVDYFNIIRHALELGYESVMIDGSRLNLAENIAATARIVQLAKRYHRPVEAELGAVMGHENGPLPPYEELFADKKGFTDLAETRQFVEETSVDFLSVAIGNLHGAIAGAARHQDKPEARIDLEHLSHLSEVAHIPLVLHGGTGIKNEYIRAGIQRGIAKINIATAIRRPYEKTLAAKGVAAAQEAVYQTMIELLQNDLNLTDSRNLIDIPQGASK